jgi:hypothetical protein
LIFSQSEFAERITVWVSQRLHSGR